MPRVKQGNRERRSELESAVLELVDVEERLPVVVLRIEQAMRRAGLSSLLQPALDDLRHVVQDTRQAKDRVAAIASQYEER